ncbi:hypothetical protein [Desulfovibrio intestinalis]|uniref:Uncharacterized protein n=1 Tax=Desulfovibrio intestinalis TaxID=58621 RepID=A0A7W8FH42_9BACT|nr:hypothetical protein [Desulfovibrio intestinalis]MBB5144576.1 hypothetical protein [Desulfovibrio intestinalis]
MRPPVPLMPIADGWVKAGALPAPWAADAVREPTGRTEKGLFLYKASQGVYK